MQLRPYQADCISAILQARSEGIRRQLAVAATGTGKSLIFSSLPQHMAKGKRMLMMVNAIELVQQGAAHLRRWNPNLSVGIEMGGEISADEDVIVASVQTIGREASKRRAKFRPDDFEWLVCDEAHLSIADTYQNVFNHFGLFSANPGCTLVGFTASPVRADKKAMSTVYEKIVFNYPLLEAIKDGWLSDVKGLKVTTTTDLSNVPRSGGDFEQVALGRAVNTPARNAIAAKEYIANGWPRRALGFTVNIQHAKDAALVFQQHGIPAEAVWGDDPERDRKIVDHRSGKTMVLFCAQLLVTGYDDPLIACILMLRPTESEVFFQQALGRMTRLDPSIDNLETRRSLGLLRPTDKIDGLLIDFVDSTSKHSLITLPTLFGLSSKLDLRGRSIIETLDAFEEADKANPGIDLSQLEDATKLKSYVEEVGLWQVRFSEAAAPHSSLMWHEAPGGNLVLLLPGKDERLVVGENLLGKWAVWGQAGGVGIDEPYYDSLKDALGAAEQIVGMLGKREASYLKKDAKWAQKKVTDKQRAILRKFRVPEAQINLMNSGQAGAIITKKFKEFAARRG